MTLNFAEVYRPPFAVRAWRKLGFGPRHDEELFAWRSEEPRPHGWWAPGALSTHITVRVDLLDRLRLLVSGRCRVDVYTRCSVPVERAEARCLFSVNPPGM